MRKFSIKVLLFSIPFIILVINHHFFQISGGDLNRLGFVSIENNYRDIFKNVGTSGKTVTDLGELNNNSNTSIDVLTFGDSFSDQGQQGYQSFLINDHHLNVVNINIVRYKVVNQIELLLKLVNGDFFDHWNVKYVLLQCVERNIVVKGQLPDTNIVMNRAAFDKLYSTKNKLNSENKFKGNIIKYSLNSLLYRFDDNAFNSQCYKVALNKKLFSTQKNELLFFKDDYENLKYNEKSKVVILNNTLNTIADKLRNKGIRLIVLPSPDKYDLYSDFIVNNKMPKNIFFDLMRSEEKKYSYIDSKTLFMKYIEQGKKDIYYADDTHWSPFGAKIIADKINEVITEQK